MVLLDICELLRLHWIIPDHGHVVTMVIERGLMGDDQILSVGNRFFQNLVGIEKRRHDAGHRRVGIAGFDRVHCIRWWRGAGRRDNALDYNRSGKRCILCLCCQLRAADHQSKQRKKQPFPYFHSDRKASIGFTPAARRAGI